MESTNHRDVNDSRPVVAALTFIVILLGIGIPVWWNTTAVQRAYLPMEEILNLSPIRGENHNLTVIFGSLDASNVPSENYEYISKVLVHRHVKIVKWKFTSEELQVIASHHSLDAVDACMKKLDIQNHLNGLWIIEVSSTLLPPGRLCVGRYNFLYISKETDPQLLEKILEITLTNFEGSEVDSKTLLPLSQQYSVLLTVASSSSSNISYTDIVATFERHVDAFTKKIDSVADLTFATQVVYIGEGPVKASHDVEQEFFFLNERNIVSLINILEPRLGGQLSSDPSFHWVLYVPNAKQSPLYIFNNSQQILSNSILSPRWNGGGLQIVNEMEQPSSGLILSQLRRALGIISIEPRIDMPMVGGYSELGYDESGIHEWELYFLKRRRTIQFYNQTIMTLKSLAELLQQISNIVVSEDIRDMIVLSVKMAKESNFALQDNNLQKAYESSQISLKSAEKAFFDPTLLALLYFPEDQKYAIYIPLFLPVGIPILLSLRSVYQHFRKM